jgi:hypothetical protein
MLLRLSRVDERLLEARREREVLGGSHVEEEVELSLEGGGCSVGARGRRSEAVSARGARTRDPVVLELDDRNPGDDADRHARCDVARARERCRPHRLGRVERNSVAQYARAFRRVAPQRLNCAEHPAAQAPELDEQGGALLLQQVTALRGQAAPSSQGETRRTS